MERKITIIGCGMGTRQGMTIEAAEALDAAGAVFGPARLTEALARAGQQAAVGYRSGELLSFLETVLEERIAVLVSGDSGFYSGAAMYLQALRDRKDIHVRICPGISSLSCLAARTGQSWEDAAIYSLHGRAQNYYASLCSGEKFVLLGGTGFSEVLGELCRSGFGSSRIWLGEQLGGAE
ncbi:MAG: precorrin-6y C5,15-methyltransferase (decarboxylating) subunit CbiE, partial [Lachnospiraceae bacterium]|nr:precorrin-6y C5,15-methyltransferase (decarboxylating) subunit CbiE [Lachnospiraceae bacterium]